MKQYSATEARAKWFSILDSVADGEEVVIERKGRRVVLRREEILTPDIPDYSLVLEAPTGDDADGWTWDWDVDSGAHLNP